MKLRFLGTAAAEGIPALFCVCEKCQRARAAGGKNIRTRSQALVNDSVLLDLGPDTYMHILQNRIDLTNIHDYLITHAHSDHFYPTEFKWLCRGYGVLPEQSEPYRVYGNGEVVSCLTEMRIPLLRPQAVEPFVPFAVGCLTVTALKAWHGTENPYFYWITDGDKDLLYAHDTDIFPEETWAYLRRSGARFDLVSMDCTEGAKAELPYNGHMCLSRNIVCRDRMAREGMLKSGATVILNHFSHNGDDACYDDFLKLAQPYGFAVSYDGMEMEI